MSSTLVFDFDGLVSYPDFADFIHSLEQTHTIFFWTLNGRSNVESTFKRIGLSHFAKKTFTIEDFYELWGASNRNNFDSVIEILREHDCPVILNDDQRSRIQRESQLWRLNSETMGGHRKHPPLLTEEPTVLIESDGTSYRPQTEQTELLRSSLIQDYLTIGPRSGFSVVLVPEFPDVWQMETSVTTFDVLDKLKKTFNTMEGKTVSIDLGSTLGLYHEYRPPSSERRG